MCGIWTSVQDTVLCTESYIKDSIQKASKLLKHRGPDSTDYKVINAENNKSIIMLHTRLHIIGDSTTQPLVDDDNQISLIINGEIFNWKELSKELNYECKKSDCEIIIPLYKKYIRTENNFKDFFNKINGQFAFILFDSLTNNIFISRDHIGIVPLYYAYSDCNFAFSSEMKALTQYTNIRVFKPRSYIFNNKLNFHHTFEYKIYEHLIENQIIDTKEVILKTIKQKLENSIKLQLSDISNSNLLDFGVLLSGGLDSSLITSIISKYNNTQIKTFSIGMSKNSTDLIASRKVADFLKTDHHEFYFTEQEGINNLERAIWYMESYDTTTIRAGTAMYLLTKKIKEKFPNLKVLFSGELSDELLSYLYGSNAPNEKDFKLETIRLVNDVHLFDCLRANKTCMANSIEVRVPFTDPDFIEYILNIPTHFKTFGKLSNNQRMEKQILRESFIGYLPNDILFRKKEAFSDGVSSHTLLNNTENWIDCLIDFCESKYTQSEFEQKNKIYYFNNPITKEQLYYREIFCKLFNSHNNTSEYTVSLWNPKWCGINTDPSARKHIKEEFTI